uniref:Immunoglobulin domain-containing protein n=1 Tax=Sinocyclocheilus rhinocerous TaxID=307959 RepID=A0A673LI11_9TELE
MHFTDLNHKRKTTRLKKHSVFGVDVDGMELVSVKEGDSVTLNSGLTEMTDEDLILWRFGSENTLIAQINVMAGSITVYDDDLDGRFRDRLKLNDQTGSLSITNTRTEHAGLYKLQTNSVSKSFSLTVHGDISVSDLSISLSLPLETTHLDISQLCHTCSAVIRLVVAALMGVAAATAVVLLINDIRSTRG